MINTHQLELPLSRTFFHGPKGVRLVEVLLYIVSCYFMLQVITSNIGRTMGFDSSESLLDKDGMTSMDFETYFDIVKTKLILKQKTDSDCTLKPLGERLSDVIKTCWTYCRYERTHKSKALGTDQCLVLWRLFNFFCETNTDGEIVLPVLLHRDEAAFICKEFIEITGQRNKENSVSVVADIPEDGSECIKFGEFQNLFEKHFLEGLSPNAVTYGLTELYEKFILEVLAKGMMSKRGFNVKTWKERWLVLTPKDLKYFVNQSQKHLKGTIDFDKDCEIEVGGNIDLLYVYSDSSLKPSSRDGSNEGHNILLFK